MSKTKLFFPLVLLAGLLGMLFSCDILRDSPYAVEAWSPGEGHHLQPNIIEVSILLSLESDKVRTEQAFSLTEDRKAIKGDFLWKGKKLIFKPASPLEKNRDYLISLGTGAQDTRGLSLETKFEAFFTTRPPGEKPVLVGTEPGHEENLFGSREEYRVFFSGPVLLNSCLDNISFTPSTPGSWRLEDGNRTACFIPREPWQKGTSYKFNVNSDFASASGAILGNAYSSVFYIGDDREKPVLLKALACFPGATEGEIYKEEIILEKTGGFPEAAYNGWESFTHLELVFSKPVTLSGLKNLLTVEPFHALIMDSPPEMSATALFHFAEFPKWGSSFIFRLSAGVTDGAGNESEEDYLFRIGCSGPLSRPPSLVGIRLPMAPGFSSIVAGESGEQEPLSFSLTDIFEDLPIKTGEGRYPYMEKIPSWIELYFETAPETEIDLFSVMDLFRVDSTNQAISFSPRSVKADDFTWTEPAIDWEEFQRIEIRGFLTNTVHSGIVTFRIPGGLMDKSGNRSSEDFRISLLK